MELYESSADILRDLRDLNLLAYPLRRSGHTARYLGDTERAAAGCRESLTLNLELNHRQGVAASISCRRPALSVADGKASVENSMQG